MKTASLQALLIGCIVFAVLVAPVCPAGAKDKDVTKKTEAEISAPVAQPASLRDVVAISVATNPEYGIAASARRVTDEELNQARSLYLPSIDLRADGGYEYSNDPATRAGVGSDSEKKLRYDTGLTLTQMLFDGFRARYENVRQQARVLSSAHRVREAAELVGLSAVESYLDVMRQRELLKIAEQNVAEHVSIMMRINDSTKAGRSTEADLQQARARLAAARAQKANVTETLRTAEASYIRDVGVVPGDLVMPDLPEEFLEEGVEEEVLISLSQSPTIDIFEADTEAAHAEYEEAKAAFMPKVDVQVNSRQGYNLGGVDGRDTSASALFVMNWNLYRGGADTAKVKEQIHREARTREARKKAARSIENDVRQTWARMMSARERAKQFREQAAANKEVVRAYKDQFELNRRTLLDVLDSQNELFVSRANSINAQFLEMFAAYRLLALKGELLPSLAVDYPAETITNKT